MNDTTHVAQVGGSHYSAGAALQHWDYMERYDIDYLTATATKYIMRWRKKGTPKLDLGKAASYVEKALKCRASFEWNKRRLMPLSEVNDMCESARLQSGDQGMIRLLLSSGTRRDYEHVLMCLRRMEQEVKE